MFFYIGIKHQGPLFTLHDSWRLTADPTEILNFQLQNWDICSLVSCNEPEKSITSTLKAVKKVLGST